MLVKGYKRYYFGLQLLALPYFKLTKNAVKIQKWQRKSCERREFLREALSGFKSAKHLYKTFHKKSEKWLNSQEFKQKYLDTKHPFPPLLNPVLLNDENSSLNYNDIPAELAWEWNLPLPRNYQMIYLFAHGSGEGKFRTELINLCEFKACGASFSGLKALYPIYLDSYNLLRKNKDFGVVQLDYNYKSTDFDKFLSLIDKKVPCLCQVRDPIELLRHYLARKDIWFVAFKKVSEFDFNFGFDDVLHPLGNFQHNQALDEIKLPNFCCVHMHHISVHLKKLKNITDIEFLDIKDIRSMNLIKKVNAIAHKFGFKALETKHQKTLQANQVKGAIHKMLPLTFYENLKDKKYPITIAVTRVLPNEVNLYEEITQRQNENYGIYIDKNKLALLRNDEDNYRAICEYLRDFAQRLEIRFEQEESAVLTITSLMNYLKNEPLARRRIYETTKDDVEIIRHYRPDIVASWKFYNEFEKMCAELDGEK